MTPMKRTRIAQRLTMGRASDVSHLPNNNRRDEYPLNHCRLLELTSPRITGSDVDHQSRLTRRLASGDALLDKVQSPNVGTDVGSLQ